MAIIVDSVREALEARILGASNIKSGIPTLDLALSLQFRLHYHVFGSGLKSNIGKVLLQEGNRLDTALNESISLIKDPESFNIVEKIIYNSIAIVHYYNNDIEEASKYLTASNEVKSSSSIYYASFNRLLNLENLYYRGLVLERSAEGKVNPIESSSNLYTENILKYISMIPIQSEGLLHSYLLLIARKINIQKFSELSKRLGSQNSIVCYLYALNISSIKNTDILKNNETELFAIGTQILKASKFPMANEPNNKKLEQFNIFLQYYFKIMENHKDILSLKDWKNFITSSMQKTFQSKNVAKAAMIFFSLTGEDKRESILNFVNHLKYFSKELELGPGNESLDEYNDPISIIDSYTFILQRSQVSDNIENLYNFSNSVDLLNSNLEKFYKDYGFHCIEPKESLEYLSNSTKLILPNLISDILILSWETLYQIRSSSLDYLVANELLSYLCNAMSLISTENTESRTLLDLQFQYAYCLAQQRQIEPSIAFLETAILETSPMLYKGWHLLALCRSIQEDKEASYKIICSVINAMEQDFEGKDYRKIPREDKCNFVNIKITEIYLINEIFGYKDALESLPNLFTVYNQLFDSNTKETNENLSFSQSKEYLLQSIWLLAAQLYTNDLDHLTDAKEAISEALKVSQDFTNVNISVTNGYLLLKQGNLKGALQEFEEVLYHDDLNVDAIIGIAQLIFPAETTNSSSEKQLVDYCKLVPDKNSKESKLDMEKHEMFFVNKVDKSAAFARLKLLIDCSLVKSIDAYFSPEIWWYLSLIHEKYGNKEIKDTLLNCIKNKETSPLRSFKFCDIM